MPTEPFFAVESRRLVAEAIARVESQTSAEVVVAVRRQSGDYRAADWIAGVALAFVSLLLILFLPQPFAVHLIPLDVAVAFAVGALVATRSPRIERWLTPTSARRRRVHEGSRAAFVDLGVSRTRARNGILIYVSLLERAVEVVADVGVDPAALGADWTRGLEALDQSLSPRADFARFQAAIEALGPVLGRAMPRADDDVDELGNEVSAS